MPVVQLKPAASSARTESTPACRAELGAKLETLRIHREAAAGALRSYHRMSAQLESAEVLLRAAQAKYAAIDSDEAGDLAAWAKAEEGAELPAKRDKERERAQREIDAATRAANTVRQALSACESEYIAAQKAASVAENAAFPAVLAVLETEALTVIEQLSTARDAFVRAERDARGMIAAVIDRAHRLKAKGIPEESVRHWLVAAERLSPKVNISAIAQTVGENRTAWADFIDRLMTNPHATFQEEPHDSTR